MALLRLDSFPTLPRTGTVPIGRVDGRRPVKLTASRLDATTNRVVFLSEEVDATWASDPKLVPFRATRGDRVIGAMAKWVRLEAQVSFTSTQVKAGMDFVVARQLAACWTAHAPFKKPDKKGPTTRLDPLLKPFSEQIAMIEHLESLDYDYWEKGKFLTAGISIPPEPTEEIRRNVSRGNWYLGVCDDMTACCSSLRNDEHVERLLQMAKAERLLFWSTRIKSSERDRRYHPRLKDDIESLLFQAIRQSLAGPMKKDVRFLGQPVANLVEWYFKDLLYWKNRRLFSLDRCRHHPDVNSL